MNEEPEPEAEPIGSPALGNADAGATRPPHQPGHSAKDFLFQLATITVGVLIALSIEGLTEWNHHRLLVREAKATIAREIADNKSALARHFTDWDRSTDGIEKALKLANELLATKQSDIAQLELGFHLSSLSDASWRTAERTGALTYMTYSDVQDYARLYGHQELYVSQQRRILDRTVSALSQLAGGDPHKALPNDLERFRLDLMALRGELLADKQLGESLAKAYEDALAKHKPEE